jgi:hypothetical protein
LLIAEQRASSIPTSVPGAHRPRWVAACLLLAGAVSAGAIVLAIATGLLGGTHSRAANRLRSQGTGDRGFGSLSASSSRRRPASASFRFFAPSSFWNAPLPTDAPLDPTSPTLIAAFAQEAADEAPEDRLNVNTTAYSVPIYTVPSNQARVRVRLDKGPGSASNPLQRAWRAVPLPADAQPAKGTDKHLVVWQPSTDEMWEFWAFEDTATGPLAKWGGAMRRVSHNPGVYDASAWRRTLVGRRAWRADTRAWGATGTSLPAVGGLITLEDLEKGKIEHALAMAVPNARAGQWASPAHRADGTSTEPTSLPEGAHLRLDPHLDLESLHLGHFVYMLAEAAQRYGIVIRDRSPNIVLYAQDPTPTATNPYTAPSGYFEGKCACKLLTTFPWSDLQVLKMTLHSRRGPRGSSR